MLKLSIAIGAAVLWAVPPAAASPVGTIDCPVQALSTQQRAGLGALMVDDGPRQSVRVHDAIAKAGAACAKAQRWSADRADAAATWGMWQVMKSELERRSGLGATDLATVRAWFAEDPSRVANLGHYSGAQVQALIDNLKGRGVHLHDRGPETERELGMLMALTEMHSQEAVFSAD